MRKTTDRILFALMALALALPVAAQTENTVEIHGFGGWAFAQTDNLKYSIGDEDGQYDNAEFALNVSARPYDRLSVVAQMRLESKGTENVELDYAFAQYQVSDALKLRVGRVKHPFGLYGEIFDVGTLRPFQSLPQGLYGPNGFTARAYNGAGITGNVDLRNDWSIQYDVFGGQIEGDFETPGLLSSVPELFTEPTITFGYRVEDTYGGRLNVSTPVNGLSFGASGYTGEAATDLRDVPPEERDVLAAHVEYSGDRLLIRAEAGNVENHNQFTADTSYLELAYRLTEKIQLAGRYDTQKIELLDFVGSVPPIFNQLLDHTDVALGLNYWVRPNFVLRTSFHWVEGNRYAYPSTREEVLEMLDTQQLDNKTTMVVVGAQFSF